MPPWTDRDPAAGKPYGSAFVSHLQTILNGQDAPGAPLKVINMSLGWSALIVRPLALLLTLPISLSPVVDARV